MNVIFVEPRFPANQREFPRALAEVGATVIGIGEGPKEALDDDLKRWLTHYEQVGSVCDENAMVRAVRWVQGKVWVDRLEATVEAHILPVARVRAACGIPGTSERTAFLCRDKPAMKETLREGGIPCAQSTAVSSVEEARDFARQVGFPLIVKPRDAAGASGTHRANDERELEGALASSGLGRGRSVALEEFIEGHEGFYDTITVNGEVVHEFVSHYYPNVLEAMRERWISPQFIATNRLDSAPGYSEVKELGRKVLPLLGIGTSATHMEWFYGPKGLKFSEIGCRPPGVRAWDLYSAANEIDLYKEWAMAIVHGRPSAKPTRRYAAGIIALRPDRDGRISGYEGLDTIRNAYGEWILDFHLPNPGTATQPVEAGYMANAWIRMRHPDYDELRRMLDEVGRTVRVRAA
jgi:formate-dependent phosphoribosylglycinamide formyltransferase (GAR transformylase)